MRKIAAILVWATLTGPVFAATNLLSNGSFENGLTGWTVTTTSNGVKGYSDPVVIKYNQAGNYPVGAFKEAIPNDNSLFNPGLDEVGSSVLYLSSDVGAQTISQNVTLAANTTYTFGFDYYLTANGYKNPNGATFEASLNGVSFASFTAGSQPQKTWISVNANNTFTTASSGVFRFTFTPEGYTAKDFAIDRVYLAETATLASVPEPASWAMMVAGFGLLGATTRRRKAGLSIV